MRRASAASLPSWSVASSMSISRIAA